MSSQTLLFADMDAQPALTFADPLYTRYRPQAIADFCGLAEVKRSLAGFVAKPRDCGILFVGPAGTGKTSMALALAHELRAIRHHVSAQECTVDRVRDLAFTCRYYPPMGYDRHIVIVDEADLMSAAAQNALLSYLDGTNTIEKCTWVFTCNSIERLHERFVSRCRQLAFSTYGIQADAAKLLERIWNENAHGSAPLNFARTIKEQNGNIRAAISILESKLDAMEGLC